jgi:hypothetical protein
MIRASIGRPGTHAVLDRHGREIALEAARVPLGREEGLERGDLRTRRRVAAGGMVLFLASDDAATCTANSCMVDAESI